MYDRIEAVPVLKDNYTWFLLPHDRTANEGVVVIDPGEEAPVEVALAGRSLVAILLTHHHQDHTGGAVALARRHHVRIFGPSNVQPAPDVPLGGGETLDMNGYAIHVLATPGHAVGHVSYFIPEIPALFSGDVLFSGGCGRLFEGTPSIMFESLRQYDNLPDNTFLCAGHEYTQANMAFIAALEGRDHLVDDHAFREREAEVKALRASNQPTLPVPLGIERRVNPFLRAQTVEALAHLRALKDLA